MKKITLLLLVLLAFCWQTNGQSIIIGTGTDDSGNTGSDPIDGYFNAFRYQVVYTAAELSASLTPGDEITGLGWSISEDYAGGALLGYTIKMGHTSATNSAAHDGSTTTTVKNAFDYDPTATAAGVFDMITFDTNFVWNGVDNVLVEVCSDGQNPFSSPYGQVRGTAGADGSRRYRVDGGTACAVDTNNINTHRPNVQFNFIDGAPPACIAPSSLGTANITDSTADLSWTENGTATVWDIEIVDVTAMGMATGTPTMSGVTNPYTAMSLSENNDYEFYVRSDCGVDGTSDWAGPFAFKTDCSTFIAPYTEGFEDGGNRPDCWTDSGAEDWSYGDNGGDHVGNGGTITGSTSTDGFYAFADASGTDADAILTSPLVDVSGLTTPALSFYLISDAEDSANSQLDVEVWDGAAWNNVGTYNTNTAGWELQTIDISGLTITDAVQVRFTFTEPTPGDFDDDIAIDDVSFDELPSCSQPSMLSISNITDTSADLGWTENGTATLWDVEIVDVTAMGMVTGTPSFSGVTNPYTATGLTADNDYEFYVRADCSGDTSSWVGPFAFRTSCSAITPDYTADMSVNVPDSCWDEAGSGEVADGPMGAGASDWRQNRAYENGGNVVNSNALNLWQNVDREWLLSPSFDLSSGGPYQLEVNVAVTNYSFSGTTTAGDTMGSDDEVQLLMSTDGGTSWTNLTTWNAGNQPSVSGTEYVEDLTGETGVVQFAIWGSDGTVDDTEDYDFHVGKFRVRAIPSCPDPASVMMTSLTDMTADFSWSAGGTETTWEYANLASPSTEPASGTSTMTTSIDFSSLTPETDYDFYVRSDCGGSFSSWVTVSYTTPATPPTNDDCANAISLTPGGIFEDNPVDGTVLGATADAETASCGLTGPGVWYSVVVPASGDITIQTGDDSLGGTGFDSVIEAFSGSCGSLTSIECDDDDVPGFSDNYSLLELSGLTPSETIYIRVWEYNGDETEPFSISAFSASLSDADFDKEASFTYYPNPVKNTLSLTAQNNIERVTMFNMLGQEVLRSTPNNIDSDIDMSGLESGAYFVKVTIENVTKTIRIIKQ